MLKTIILQTAFLIVAAISFIFFALLPGCGPMLYLNQMEPAEHARNECVILVHGLGRTSRSMGGMQKRLTQEGYDTVNLGYPSRKKAIAQLAEEYIPPALERCGSLKPAKIHFITHSLGGIVVRMALKQDKPEKLGRVVMLSPPNQGSGAVNKLLGRWYYSWITGPAGQELSTSKDSVPNQLGPVDYPVGIITGDRHAFFDSWLESSLPGADDGKVSVERAKVAGMTDFIVVHESHPYIMKSDHVQSEAVHFLKKGFFLHDDGDVPAASGENLGSGHQCPVSKFKQAQSRFLGRFSALRVETGYL